jgi:hypothetical protein
MAGSSPAMPVIYSSNIELLIAGLDPAIQAMSQSLRDVV